MQTYYDRIYIAPHLDDVALSCGGQICTLTQRGERILIATVMAGDPPPTVSAYAQSLHDRWGLPLEASENRRREDIEACTILGATALHWSITDCIYRLNPTTGEPLYNSDDDLFGPIAPADEPLIDVVADLIWSLPAHKQLVVPLAVGHHVDHEITRRASERRFGDSLVYYEDYPYVQTEGSLDFLRATDQERWEPFVYEIGPQALIAKIEAIMAYRSQLSTFFEDRQDLERQVNNYTHVVGGERLWRRVD